MRFYRKTFSHFLLALVLSSAGNASADPLPAFPGAAGFGSTTVGGSGRHLKVPKTTVFHVTSLADSGAGTLRECVTAPGPRVCIFETSGWIDLTKKMAITEPYLTIAGQTAPSPGIEIRGAGLKIATHDVIVRDIAVRPGDAKDGPKPSDRDGIVVNGKDSPANNVLIDHVSLTWALDENADIYGANAKDVTFSNALIAEGLYHSIHPDGPHSMGMLVGDDVQNISVHDCLFEHNNDRNPRQKAGSSLEFYNNVIYDWGGLSGAHGANPSDTDRTNKKTLLNFAGNNYIPGPNSPRRPPIFVKPASNELRIYVEHNIGPGRTSDTGNEWAITANIDEVPYRSKAPAFAPSGVLPANPAENVSRVLSQAGSRPHERDAADTRLIAEVKKESGDIRDCIENCAKSVGGYPALEVHSRKLTPPAADKDSDHNGYTDLEDWLNCFADAVERGGPSNC